jgi:hypothetical protein
MKKIVLSIVASVLIFTLVIFFLFYKGHLRDMTSYKSKFENFVQQNVEKPVQKKNICITTLETRKSKMLNIHDKNVMDYSIKHGYMYFSLNSYKSKLELPIYWKKIQVVKDILYMRGKNGKPLYDYVMWMDSDTIFVDNRIAIESFLRDNKSIYIGNDFGTDRHNAGVFIIKNNTVGRSFIEHCIHTFLNKDECKDENGNPSLKGGWSGDCYEQGIMNDLLKTVYVDHYVALDDHIIFNYNKPTTNAFILHLFGGKERYEHRDQVFEDILYNDKTYDKFSDQLIYVIQYGLNQLKQKLIQSKSDGEI